MTASHPTSAAIEIAATIPMAMRLSHEIPKPRNWQDFQRNCLVLFKAELRDPHGQEYGRDGEEQHGIDLLARRDGNHDYQVAVQCRRYKQPLTYDAMLTDCRRALAHFGELREIIFATTFQDSAKVNDRVGKIERLLRSEGHQVRVLVYGWEALQHIVVRHDEVYVLFCPWILSTSAALKVTQETAPPSKSVKDGLAETLRQVLRPELLNATPTDELNSVDRANEDAVLHARIDGFRDMFTKDWLVQQAERGLAGLLEIPDLDNKPWAKFRILSNLASLAFATGREAEAISGYEEAHKLLPEDAVAKANLALARTMQGRFEEAIQLAQEALTTVPRSDQALGYLLQAAARSNWQGEPETLIPPDLAGSVHADLGLAEFYRRREVPGWQQRSIEIGNRHPDVPEFRPIHALAVLSLALDSGLVIAGGLGPISSEDLTAAANESKAWIERMLDRGVGGEHDQRAHLNNACVLLRLCDRHEEAEQLLVRARILVDGDPVLRRLLAVVQLFLGKRRDAIETLSGDTDTESRLFLTEIIAEDDLTSALEQAHAIQTSDLSNRLRTLRAQMIAELAQRLDRQPEFDSAIAELRTLEPDEPFADLVELRAEKKRGLAENEYREALLELARNISDRASIMGRTLLATELQDADRANEASLLLDGRVDLSRVTPTSIFYLHTLAASRRDEAFGIALESSSEALRNHPDILWFRSAQAWNMGDLDGALTHVSHLLEHRPELARARMFKLEVLLRRNETPEVLAELARPLENLPGLTFQENFRLASLLRHLGFIERAAHIAYRMFLEDQGNPRAWIAVMNLVLANGRKPGEKSYWDVSTVGPNVAVNLKFDDGQEVFFVVEPDPDLRKLDKDSWEPDHALVKTVNGLAADARFVDANGREGSIINLRHKIVARFQYVMEYYQARFPSRHEIKSIRVDLKQPDGLDEIRAQLQERSDWVRQEQEQWDNGQWPLSYLAIRLQNDVIDVAAGLAAQGFKLKVALGNDVEKQGALKAIRSNQKRGCVLDLHSFWTAWRLQILPTLEAVGGRIHVCQGVVDRLRARQERLQASARDGQKSAHLENGQIALLETPADLIQEWIGDLDRAIAWLHTNSEICPVVISDDLPPLLRDHLTISGSDIYDALAVSMQMDLLFVTDDLPTRVHGFAFGFQRSCWTQAALRTALHERRIAPEIYVRAVANLIGAGHNYLGISGPELACALRMDIRDSEPVPGRLFSCLAGTIGGKGAEPVSHTTAVVAFLLLASDDPETRPFWKAAASDLLRKLLRERHGDYIQILRAVLAGMQANREVFSFLLYWARGHFIPLDALT